MTNKHKNPKKNNKRNRPTGDPDIAVLRHRWFKITMINVLNKIEETMENFTREQEPITMKQIEIL